MRPCTVVQSRSPWRSTAAGAITGAGEIVVIGSQAILGSRPDAPTFLLRSSEADLFTLRDPKDADLIDGSTGESSPFHETFGYYAQGVREDTAVLPEGWKNRLVSICNENTRGVVALCLEPHDLAAAKLVAGREKDFLIEMVRHRMLDEETMMQRIDLLPPGAGDGVDLRQRWERVMARAST